jgi:hypothetical protein
VYQSSRLVSPSEHEPPRCVELSNDSLVPILLELKNPSPSHNSKEVD